MGADNDIVGTPDAVLRQGACGTSFASPYSMGASALVRDYFVKGFYPSGANTPADTLAPSGALVKAVLLTERRIDDLLRLVHGEHSTYGQGMGRIKPLPRPPYRASRARPRLFASWTREPPSGSPPAEATRRRWTSRIRRSASGYRQLDRPFPARRSSTTSA